MHAVLMRVDVFSCHVSFGKIRREEHILVRTFYTVRVETHTGREMMVDGRLSYGGIYSCAKTEYNPVIPEIPPEWYFPLIDLVKTTTKVNTVAKTAVFYGMNTTGSGIFCCIFHSKFVRRFYVWPEKFHSATKSYETHTSSTKHIVPS